jgi:ABC-type transport system involved in multi-copper enzyme maturation permease subunit
VIFITLVRRSLARHRALIASLTILLSGLQFLIVVIAASLQRDGLYSQLAALVPAFIQEAMGGAFSATFGGTIALGFFHPVVMLSLSCAAIYMASEPAGEVEDGLVDLVVARPVPRRLVVTRSAFVYASVTAFIVLLMFLANRTALRWLAPAGAEVPASRLWWVALNLLAVVWCFGAAALALGARLRRRAAAAGGVALAAVFLYLLQFAAAAWVPLRPFGRISPFHYYEALRTLQGLGTPAKDIAVLLSAMMALLAAAYASYLHRDL